MNMSVDGYRPEITKDGMQFGCRTYKFSQLRKLIKAHDKAVETGKTVSVTLSYKCYGEADKSKFSVSKTSFGAICWCGDERCNTENTKWSEIKKLITAVKRLGKKAGKDYLGG